MSEPISLKGYMYFNLTGKLRQCFIYSILTMLWIIIWHVFYIIGVVIRYECSKISLCRMIVRKYKDIADIADTVVFFYQNKIHNLC